MQQEAVVKHKDSFQKRNKNKGDANLLSEYVFGKVQPQAVPLEEAVLGAIMLDKDALPTVMDVLSVKSFYSDGHQAIYKAMLALYNRSHPVDMLTVNEELKRNGDLELAGGTYHLVELTNRVASTANIEYHAKIIQQKFIQRELIRVSNQTLKDAYEDQTDVFTLLDQTEQEFFDIGGSFLTKEAEDIENVGVGLLKEVYNLREMGEDAAVNTGFVEVDRVLNGLLPGDLGILAARPGMGKTAFVLGMALNVADFGKNVAIFSLEMSNNQLFSRMAAIKCEFDAKKLRNPRKMTDADLTDLVAAVEEVSSSYGKKIFVDDTPAINHQEIKAKIRRLVMKNKVQFVIVDYLQLMSGVQGQSKSREQEVSQISRALKGAAKEFGVPILALSQLSRQVEQRGGSKRPQLSDLRESGAIEQDADMVSFIYRPEYYQILENEEGHSLKGIAEFIIAKNRAGDTGTAELKFVGQYTRFEDLPDENFADLPTDSQPNNNQNNLLIDRKNAPKMGDEDIPF